MNIKYNTRNLMCSFTVNWKIFETTKPLWFYQKNPHYWDYISNNNNISLFLPEGHWQLFTTVHVYGYDDPSH